jgi:hypothetical protein
MPNILPPSKKRKGAPPKEEETSYNLDVLSDTDIVAMNFKVSAEFRREMKQYAAAKNISMTNLLVRAFEEYRQRH